MCTYRDGCRSKAEKHAQGNCNPSPAGNKIKDDHWQDFDDCSESEDSAILNLRIQHSNSLCGLMSLLFSCSLSSPQDLMHCTLSLTVCTCTPCQCASFISTTDSFSWGHDPYTVACKARPSFDGCGTSLSVSLSLSLSLSLSMQFALRGDCVALTSLRSMVCLQHVNAERDASSRFLFSTQRGALVAAMTCAVSSLVQLLLFQLRGRRICVG